MTALGPTISKSSLAQQLLLLCGDDTTTGCEDRGLKTLTSLWSRLSAKIELQEVSSGRSNVLATFGDPAAAKILFTTHLDTVPVFFPPRQVGDVIYGRGSCDAKGQIIAQFAAIERLLSAGRRDVAWLGVIGEETDSIGAEKAKELGPRLSSVIAVIDGEPTDNQLATGQRGIVQMKLECDGIPAHSGRPENGRSAIYELIGWIERLRAEVSPVDPDLGPEVFNVGFIYGGGALNVVPAHAEAKIMARTVPGSEFAARVQRLAPAAGRCEVFHETRYDRFPEIPGHSRKPVPFGSDAPRLRSLAKDGVVVLVGPGSIDVAHTMDERLDLADLEAGIEKLHALANHFLTLGRSNS